MAHPLRLQRLRSRPNDFPVGTIYVGRPSLFGNPFRGEGAVEAYRKWLAGRSCEMQINGIGIGNEIPPGQLWMAFIPEWDRPLKIQRMLPGLRGRHLACWCPLDKPCHADVICELANGPEGEAF